MTIENEPLWECEKCGTDIYFCDATCPVCGWDEFCNKRRSK